MPAIVRYRRNRGIIGGAAAAAGYFGPIVYRASRALTRRFMRNQRRAASNEIPRRIGLGFKRGMLGQVLPQRKKQKTNAQAPTGQGLGTGSVTIGDSARYTRSKTTVGTHKIPSRNSKKNVYRWQSLAQRTDTTSGSYSLSLPLTVGAGYDSGQWRKFALPMYAFNMSSIGGQGRFMYNSSPLFNVTGTSVHEYCNVPMYRLVKQRKANEDWLAPNTKNYAWEAVAGVNNSPLSDIRGTTYYDNPLSWQCEDMGDIPGNMGNAVHLWSNAQLLIQCARGIPCKIHIALAKFVNPECAPDREFVQIGQSAEDGPVVPVATTIFDQSDDQKAQNEADAFWESFWCHRIVHPLANYAVADKMSCLKFIKHDVITCHADDSAQRHGPYIHQKDFMFHDGAFQNLCVPAADDTTVLNGRDALGRLNDPSVAEYAGVAPYPPIGDVLGFHQITRNFSPVTYQDRNKDCWLLIWMDTMVQGAVVDNIGPVTCSFDIKVRSKFATDPATYRPMTDGLFISK